jgi:signal transduction histidine kinase
MNRLRGLPAQLFLFIVLPLTALLVAVAFGGLAVHQRAMRQMVAERDERAARAAAAALEAQLRGRADIVTNLALHAAHVDPATALADSAAFHDQFLTLAIVDASGEVVATNSAESDRLGNWWEAMSELPPSEPGFFLVDSVANSLPPVLLVAAPMAGGVVAGTLDPAALAREVLGRVILPGDHSAAYLVAPDGSLLFQTGEMVTSHEESIREHPGVAEALRGESGTTFLSGNEDHVISFTPVVPTGWALVMEEDWREMTDPLLRRTEIAPFVLLPALAVALAGLWFGARQIVRPLQALATRTTALGRGDFDAVREPVGGISEIRQLQGELVLMARRLHMAQQGLRDYLGALTRGQEEERHRLARELHDDTIQSLIVLNQRLHLAESQPDGPTATQAAELQELVAGTIDDLRRLTRDLRPSYLDDLGLVPALELLARDATAALGIPVTFTSQGEPRRATPDVELAYYRIAQEALRNAGRHAQASQVVLVLDFMPEQMTLTIRDDGVGFDPAQAAAQALDGHFGLLGARERAEAVGARLVVESAPGMGSTVIVTGDE